VYEPRKDGTPGDERVAYRNTYVIDGCVDGGVFEDESEALSALFYRTSGVAPILEEAGMTPMTSASRDEIEEILLDSDRVGYVSIAERVILWD